MLSFLESVFAANFFAWIEGMEKTIIFFRITRWVIHNQLRINLWKKTFFDENLQRYCVSFIEHEAHYNFYDSRELVSDFLTVFENIFIPRADLRLVRLKYTFTIVNSQPVRKVGFVEITDSRVWQRNVYDGVYFNDFIKSKLAQDILKRVIMNGMMAWL